VDDNPVLRTLAADLERDDPRLAAFLSGRRNTLPPAHRHHPVLWIAAAALVAMLALAVTLPVTVTVGVLAMLVVIASPLAVCWLCSVAEEPPHPRTQ
jgi:cobalamin biosynthesis protein CobD/CbiB